MRLAYLSAGVVLGFCASAALPAARSLRVPLSQDGWRGLSQRGSYEAGPSQGGSEDDPLAGQRPSVSETYLLAAANSDRIARGLRPLRVDPHLVLAARAHANEMARRGTISHQFPGEEDLAARAGNAGAHFALVTENVAQAPDASRIHDLWMNSEGHRANLLDPHVDAVGIAVVKLHGEYYAVEDFAHIIAKLTLPEQEAEVASLLERTGLAISAGTPDARETCRLSTGYVGERKPWFVMRYTSSDIDRLPAQLTDRISTGRYREAAVGACYAEKQTPFTSYSLAVLLYP